MKKISIIIFSVLTFFSCLYSLEVINELSFWEKQINKIVPVNFKGLQILSEHDIALFKEYGRDQKAKDQIYNQNLKGYKEKKIFSYISGDFQGMGKTNYAFACKMKKDLSHSYLIIIEKRNKQYYWMQAIEFPTKIFFIYGFNNNLIQLCFQYGTDWYREVFWTGTNYQLKDIDEAGP